MLQESRDTVANELGPKLRMAVGYLDCPRLARDALTYFMLVQNSVQRVFDFSVINLYPYATELSAEVRVSASSYHDRAAQVINIAQNSISSEWGKSTQTKLPLKWLVITEVPLEDFYYLRSNSRLAVLSWLTGLRLWTAVCSGIRTANLPKILPVVLSCRASFPAQLLCG